MGIRGFKTFLNVYPIPLLTRIDVADQYVLIDCRGLLFEIVYEFDGKIYRITGNYTDFRERVLTYFRNLQRCGIKPILIYDGFKRRENNDVRPPSDDSSCYPEMSFRRTLYLTVLKQTAAELNIPWFSANHLCFEDLAALSQLLQIPVVSNNTVFAGFKLDKPYILQRKLCWKEPQESQGKLVLKGQEFSLTKFIETFRLKEEYFTLFCILFENKSFEIFENFRREAAKKDMMIPRHLRTEVDTTFRRPNFMEKVLIWFTRTRSPVEKIIDDVVKSIPYDEDKEQTRRKILERRERFKNPKVKRLLLLEMIDKIDDPLLSNLLHEGLDEAIVDDSNEFLDEATMRRIYKGNFPAWVPRFLSCQASGKHFVFYRDMFSNIPPKCEHQHRIVVEIFKVSYQLLSRQGGSVVTVDFFDKIGDEYNLASSILIEQLCPYNIDVYKPKEEITQAVMDQRKEFLLSVLFPEVEYRNHFINQEHDICDDLKLPLAVTHYWMKKSGATKAACKAITMMFAFMQVKNQRTNSTCVDMFEHIVSSSSDERREENESNQENSFTQWALLWEACCDAAITLNQILNFPLPEPALGKIYSFSVFQMFSTKCEIIAKAKSMLYAISAELDDQ